ncbi:hypothetical protein HPS26_10485 [Klebsiella aerogenes]|uniref:hypothetical protein n=1 Tax=Klebsiella aerogenes TaxID=548 RepID=UPI0014950B6C|nr:hypothetical protein [Klebsiella aerogenes]NPD50455.1 hypothetical protein [Klebsiella aerogenes]NPD77628.1 hypothetical protein [Klebsiella aerogenes]
MGLNYKAIGISHFDVNEFNQHAFLALGECLALLIFKGKDINKENMMETLISELERQHDDTHKAYRLALEIVGVYGR